MDLELIKNQVSEVIEYSQSISNPQVSELIDKWYEQKQYFIKLFNGPIYRTPKKITVHMDEEEQHCKVEDFINEIVDSYYCPGFKEFMELNKDCFFTNITNQPFKMGEINIPAGVKISKAFKYFFDDPKVLYKVQTKASMIIQSNKITGYLCLSVHPLDFLSSSENTHNWRSCHSLDGEYKGGNLSYMLDSCTVCCYVCGAQKCKLPRFPDSILWNNKKWRMLLFLSNTRDAMFAGRQYPFFSFELMDMVKTEWAKLVGPTKHYFWEEPRYTWSNWHNEYLTKSKFKTHDPDNFHLLDKYAFLNGVFPLKEIIQDAPNSLHFNDLLNSSFYLKPYYAWKKEYYDADFAKSNYKPIFNIGSKVPCLCCGKKTVTEHGSMMCSDCLSNNGYITCADCGATISEDDAIWVEYLDRYICRICYEDNYRSCANCGEIFHYDDLMYNNASAEYYCETCYNELKDD